MPLLESELFGCERDASRLADSRPRMGEPHLSLRRRISDEGAPPQPCGAISEIGERRPHPAAGFLSLGRGALIWGSAF